MSEALNLAQLTQRIGAETLRLATAAGETQLALSLLGLEGRVDEQSIVGLQALDRLTQELEDLARLLDGLGQALPDGIRGPRSLLALLRLRDLALRLGADHPAPPPPPSGEVTWL